MKVFNTEHLRLMKQALNVYLKQQEAIAQNVANADNDNYRRINTDFSETLRSVNASKLKATNERHIRISSETTATQKAENEGVNLTREMGDLAVNQIKFDFVARTLNRFYSGLRTSITGRIR